MSLYNRKCLAFLGSGSYPIVMCTNNYIATVYYRNDIMVYCSSMLHCSVCVCLCVYVCVCVCSFLVQ